MKNKSKFFIGFFTFTFIIGLNVRHILSNYGVSENNLHVEILAQTNTGTGTGSGSGSGDCLGCPDYNYVPNRYIKCGDPVSAQFIASAHGEIIIGGITLKGFNANAQVTISIVIFNCDGEQECACCDQRKVGPKPASFSWPD